MKIRRFEGKDTQEALMLAQAALGADAVILQTRRVKANGLTGLLGTSRVEVLAAADPAARPRAAAAAHPVVAPARQPVLTQPPTPNAQRPTGRSVEQELLALRVELAQLRAEVSVKHDRPEPVSETPRIAPRPRAAALTYNPLASLAEEPSTLEERLNEELVTRTIDIRPGRCTTVALVGPTGVGKTTTLAKLAAVASHVERKKVALLTVDTYRIAGVEQLNTYAGLLSLPLEVPRTPAEVEQARARFRDCDLLLIDTTGRSPRGEAQLDELAELIRAADPDETHLLLDARSSTRAAEQVLEGFTRLSPTHLALTKVDETPEFDAAVEAALECGLPLSYLSTGQSVPEDLAAAGAEQILQWMRGARP